MSKVFTLMAAAAAVAFTSLAAPAPAVAGPLCDGTVHHGWGGSRQCYYLPTVSNGRVTGVEKHVSFGPNGGPVYHPQSSCRYLPTVAGGRVTGSHLVC